MKAWHFTKLDKRLSHGDGRQIRAGRTLKVKFPAYGWAGIQYPAVSLCKVGLHASLKADAAMRYAEGPYLWRVDVPNPLAQGLDKIAGAERTALWGFNALPILDAFSRQCALSFIHQWDAPDAVVQYLETGDPSLREAARELSGKEWGARIGSTSLALYLACIAAGFRGIVTAKQSYRTVGDISPPEYVRLGKIFNQMIEDHARSKGYEL